MKPRLAFQVENTLQGDESKMNVELRFNHLDDFSPDEVVKQIEPLRKLLETTVQPLARLHALWSLHGLEALTDAEILKGLADPVGGTRTPIALPRGAPPESVVPM